MQSSDACTSHASNLQSLSESTFGQLNCRQLNIVVNCGMSLVWLKEGCKCNGIFQGAKSNKLSYSPIVRG